ncbi:MAG: hypothetical protein C0485_04300 [Pirellula sp.]|nr:hypothetical protein [Pirellula sp.]
MPRPRFTLRVMLAVTAIAAVVAWQGGIVYQRRSALSRVRRSVANSVIGGNQVMDLEMRLNPIRKLMGDESIRLIIIRDDASGVEVESLKELFPEARVFADNRPEAKQWGRRPTPQNLKRSE